jgi:16S rRNA (cytosine967-C5)-methyltransferase
MRRRGQIVAVDASGERLAELDAGRERAGLDGELTLEIIEAELGAELPEHAAAPLKAESFDAVLLDAPCTGLGNLGRHPELRWTALESNIGDRAVLQATLLRWCAGMVRPGGRLVYAVCSLEPEEGEAIVAAFCGSDAGRGFARELTQAWTPEEHQTDGFWLARLRRID